MAICLRCNGQRWIAYLPNMNFQHMTKAQMNESVSKYIYHVKCSWCDGLGHVPEMHNTIYKQLDTTQIIPTESQHWQIKCIDNHPVSFFNMPAIDVDHLDIVPQKYALSENDKLLLPIRLDTHFGDTEPLFELFHLDDLTEKDDEDQ